MKLAAHRAQQTIKARRAFLRYADTMAYYLRACETARLAGNHEAEALYARTVAECRNAALVARDRWIAVRST